MNQLQEAENQAAAVEARQGEAQVISQPGCLLGVTIFLDLTNVASIFS